MSYPGLVYDFGDSPTEKQIEHQIHKEQGDMFSWCEECREDEICEKCHDSEPAKSMCIYCETSGRKIP